jgi:hypothetical protein
VQLVEPSKLVSFTVRASLPIVNLRHRGLRHLEELPAETIESKHRLVYLFLVWDCEYLLAIAGIDAV